MERNFYEGKRLSFDGHLCTVRYVGPVQGTEGNWLGVEWDDATRGKHNGERDGVRYFQCVRKSPTTASFVRPSRPSDPPRSFVKALKAKYASERVDPKAANGRLERAATTGDSVAGETAIKIGGKEVEEVGFDKIRERLADFQELRIVLLDGLAIQRPVTEILKRAWNTPGLEDGLNVNARPTPILNTCPKVIELDLSRNLFESWSEVASICEELPDLRSLRCDGNRFRDVQLTELERQYFQRRFPRIRTLNLDDNLLSWRDLAAIASLFTGLATFTASCNDLTSLDASQLPTTLTAVTLEDNGFRSLADVAPLRQLPHLQKLVLRNNRISSIGHHPTQQTDPPVFPSSLHHLDIFNNAISTWTFITALPSTLPGLHSLRISNNPLYHTLHAPSGAPLTADDGYILTIARLPQLRSLNHSTITPKDRLNADTYYLAQIAAAMSLLPSGTAAETVTAAHPRYAALCAEYGAPDAASRPGRAASANSLGAHLLELRLRYRGEEAGVLQVPKRCSVYTVQGLVGKALGLAPCRTRLVWETGETCVAATAGDDGRVDAAWDSDGEEEGAGRTGGETCVLREVELVAGTRAVTTWVDGDEAVLRVEMR